MTKQYALATLFAVTPLVCLSADPGTSREDDDAPSYSRKVGPLTLSAGVVDTKIRVGVDGKYDKTFHKFQASCSDGVPTSDKMAHCRFGTLGGTVKLDSAWKSGSDARNYLDLNLSGSVLQELSGFQLPKPPPPGVDCSISQGGVLTPSPIDPRCNTSERSWAFGGILYPELGYRYGNIDQGGKSYDANQVYYGGGLKFYTAEPDTPRVEDRTFFVESPYVSFAYNKVDNNGGTDAPAPEGIDNEYLVTEGFLNVYLQAPHVLEKAILDRVRGPGSGCRPAPGHLFSVSAKLTGSHPTSGGGWEVAREYKLVMQTGTSLTPMLSYKTGEDRGFTYDKQVLLGFAMSFFKDPPAPKDCNSDS